MNVQQILGRIVEDRIIAVVRCRTREEAELAIEAIVAGAIHTVEITTTTPRWEMVIAATRERWPEALVGVGTALEVEQVERAAAVGARFAASPVYDPLLMKAAAERGLVRMPGGATPTELYRAHRDGCELLKLFPVPADPVSMLRALRGPLPNLRIAPSGGVTDTTAPLLLAAGATALNVGSWLTHRSDGTLLDRSEIVDRAVRLRGALSANTA